VRLTAIHALLLIAATATLGCASFAIETRSPDATPEPRADERARDRGPDSIRIPPGHFPPPGKCRVWHPGTPPGHQPPPGACSDAERLVGPGDWLIYRPTDEKKVVRVSIYDTRSPGVRIAVRIYDLQTGRFLREL
jgi:hypothetical protein